MSSETIKNTLTVSMLIAFIAIYVGVNSYFSDARQDHQTGVDYFAKLTHSLLISPLSPADFQELCRCEITTISSHPLTFTLHRISDEYMSSMNNPLQMEAYKAAQEKSTQKICGLLQDSQNVITRRNGGTVTTFEGTPFTSAECDNLWAEGRAFFKPERSNLGALQ
jgi:hypothetical protein